MVQVLSVAGFSAYFCQSGSLGKKMPYPSKRSPQRQANSPMGWAWNTSEPLRIASQWGKGFVDKQGERDEEDVDYCRSCDASRLIGPWLCGLHERRFRLRAGYTDEQFNHNNYPR